MAEKVYQNVLIFSTDSRERRTVVEVLARCGLRGTAVSSPADALDRLTSRDWDMVLLDASPADGGGMALLGAVRSDRPDLPVAMIGPDTSARLAVEALRAGCEEFLVRPVEAAAMEALFESLLPNHDVPLAASAQKAGRCLYQIAGRSEALTETLAVARKVAPTSMPVLITGESGTGKELLSYFVHSQSRRSAGPYVRVNCAALSESLLESELFGHERGAFTGACARRKGRFERAHGGTLLLDEISETTARLQAELLRVLEQQDFERVGGSEPIRVDVRVICTSNRDLTAEMRAGRFRRDLYYRISGIHVEAPPLRRRPKDIPVLVWHFVNLYAREARRRIAELDPQMLAAFSQYSWPGNVRELRNVVRTALVLGEGATLSLGPCQQLTCEDADAPVSRAADLSLQELERQAIFEALRRTQSHQAKAAGLLGITDRTLREKLRRYRRNGQLEPSGERQWLVEPA